MVSKVLLFLLCVQITTAAEIKDRSDRPIQRINKTISDLTDVVTSLENDCNQKLTTLTNKLEQLFACPHPALNVIGASCSLAVGDNGGMTANCQCPEGFRTVLGSPFASTCNEGVTTRNGDFVCMREDDGYTVDVDVKLYYRIYKDDMDRLSVKDAKAKCRTDDPRRRLIVLNTENKKDKIVSVLNGQNVYENFWLGAERSSNGVFDRWVDGSLVGSAWHGGQLDNRGGNQNCATFYSYPGYGLFDDACTGKHRFICEIPIF